MGSPTGNRPTAWSTNLVQVWHPARGIRVPLPGFVSKYAIHETQQQPTTCALRFGICKAGSGSSKKWFSPGKVFFRRRPDQEDACIYNASTRSSTFRWNNAPDQMSKLYSQIKQFQLGVLRSYSVNDHNVSERILRALSGGTRANERVRASQAILVPHNA